MFERDCKTNLKCDFPGCQARSEQYANAADAVAKSKGWIAFNWHHYCPGHAEDFIAERTPKPEGS